LLSLVAAAVAVVLQTATVTAGAAQVDLERAQVCRLLLELLTRLQWVLVVLVVPLALLTMEHLVTIPYLAQLPPLAVVAVLEAESAEMLA
jgi:hypothetical protein